MGLNRRTVAVGLAAWSGWSGAQAQAAAPVEGTEYVRLAQPVATGGAGRVEVLAFFWYGSPRCQALEPALEAWVARLPADVAFRRVPVGFSPAHELHQRVFYALEAMGQLAGVHRKLFSAAHGAGKPLHQEAEWVSWVGTQGLDAPRFAELMKSAEVLAKARAARQTTAAYRIDSVPALGVQGRYYTSAALAGGPERVLRVVDALIPLARKAPR